MIEILIIYRRLKQAVSNLFIIYLLLILNEENL